MASCAPKRAADQLHGLAIRKLSSFFPFSFFSFFPPFPFLLSSFPFLSLFISLHQNRILAVSGNLPTLVEAFNSGTLSNNDV